MERNKVKVLSNLLIKPASKVIGKMEIFMDKVSTYGQKKNIQAVLIIIWCMALEYFNGKMEKNIKDNIDMEKNMDMDNSIGLMVEYTKVDGTMEIGKKVY